MKYYLITYKKEKILVDKKELFLIFDNFFKANYGLLKVVGENINYSYGRIGFKTDAFKIVSDYYCDQDGEKNYFRDQKIYLCANHFCYITTDKGVKVDPDIIINQYYQSRGIIKNKSRSYYIKSGTKNEKRKYTRFNRRSFYGKGFKSEYLANLSAKEVGVKIRAKRNKNIAGKLMPFCNEFDKEINTSKSWKQNKKRKQYDK